MEKSKKVVAEKAKKTVDAVTSTKVAKKDVEAVAKTAKKISKKESEKAPITKPIAKNTSLNKAGSSNIDQKKFAQKVAENKVLVSRAKPEIAIPTLEEFLEVGAHFGHETGLWNPKMIEYIYTERNNIHILDLIKTMKMLKKALNAIQEYSDRGNILIVGTKGQASRIVKEVAEKVGAFYVDKRWPGGLFTNFEIMKRSFKKLIKFEETVASSPEGMIKKELLKMKKEAEKMNKLYGGIKLMDKLPSLLIVIDSRIEKKAVKEAIARKIPVVALMDTNCSPDGINYIVPANDDSIKSIGLFVELFGKAIKGTRFASSILSMRVDYYTNLEKMRIDRENEIQRKLAMEEENRNRLKALKNQSTVVNTVDKEGRVVRVVSK